MHIRFLQPRGQEGIQQFNWLSVYLKTNFGHFLTYLLL